MARKGKNSTGSKKNYSPGHKKQEKKKNEPMVRIPDHPVLKIVEDAYREVFWSPGYEWRGLQTEYVKPNGVCIEMNYYLEELEDEVLYEQTFKKMLKGLKAKGDIEWYELVRQPVPWDDGEREFLRLRVK